MLRSLTISAILMLLATTASAHHNWAATYDVNTDIEIEGVISSIEWRNPHIRVSFTVNGGTSNEKIYTTESNSVASLTRMEVTADLLSVGTPVRVAGYRSRTSDTDIFMNHLLLPSNREVIFLRTADPRWPDAARVGNTARLHGGVVEDDFTKRPTSVFGVWTTVFGGQGSHQALGKDPAQWTEKGKEMAELAANTPVDSSCTPKAMPGVMGNPYPIQLIDQGEMVIIHAEEFDSIREVHMGVPHMDPGTADILGYSTGRWIENTLTVTTTFGGSESDMRVLESFSLSGDHNRLLYSQVIVDPEMRVMPTVNKKWWQYQPGAFVQPYECSY